MAPPATATASSTGATLDAATQQQPHPHCHSTLDSHNTQWWRLPGRPPARPPACLLQVFFEASNHWLYLEEPDKFNKLVGDFAATGFLHTATVVRL